MDIRTIIYALLISPLFCSAAAAQQDAVALAARSGIDAGNQAWVDGIERGNAPLVTATYAEQAVDCDPAGNCIRGRLRIGQHMRAQFARLGKAQSAAVQSWGSRQYGDFVYEWGLAEATFPKGIRLREKYLTVWQKQPDNSWKIYRNMVIPEK